MVAGYDLSKGERGKFFRPDAEMRLPIYLDADVRGRIERWAAQKGIRAEELVNDLLRRQVGKLDR